jgi:hypothetical protein
MMFRDPIAVTLSRVKLWQAYLAAVLIYGLGEKILLPLYQGYFHVSGDLSTWRPDIEALFNGFVSFPMIVVAYVWQTRAAHRILMAFDRAGSFRDKAALDGFLADTRVWMRQDRWWALSALLAVAALFWQALWLWDPNNPKPVEPWFHDGEPTSRIVALALSLPFWYFVSQIVIGEVRVAVIVRRMFTRLGDSFQLRAQGCDGGLASLSRHVTIMATISAVVLLNLILGLLLPQIRETEASPDFLLWVIVIWSAYLAVIPALILALIWPVHNVMARRKDAWISGLNRHIETGFAQVESGVADSTEMSAAVERIDGLRKVREWVDTDLPRWPVRNAMRTVSWSAVVPLALSLLSFVLDRVV